MTKEHVICLASFFFWNGQRISIQEIHIFPLLWPFLLIELLCALMYIDISTWNPKGMHSKSLTKKVPKNTQKSVLVTLERKEDSVQDFQNFLRLEYFFSSNFTIVVSELKMSNDSKLYCNKTTIITWWYSTHLKLTTFGKSNRFVCFDYVRDTFDAHWKHSLTCC